MSADTAPHRVVLELEEPIPSEVPVGSSIVLKVRVSCTLGCDLGGRLVEIMSGEELLAACVHGELAALAPAQLGKFSWTILFPQQEVGGVAHGPGSIRIAFDTTPLASSVAVWDVPSPVVLGAPFTVKVGVKSSGGRELKAATVEVLDDGGSQVGSSRLGGITWGDTTGLYWTEVQLVAPAREGIVSWSARFPAQEADLPHGEAVAFFSFAAVRPPEHRLTIRVIEGETGKPIENAHIRLGPFRSLTDAGGVAELSMPKGTYEIRVWHAAYEAPPMSVNVVDSGAVELVAFAVPEEDPSARFMM